MKKPPCGGFLFAAEGGSGGQALGVGRSSATLRHRSVMELRPLPLPFDLRTHCQEVLASRQAAAQSLLGLRATDGAPQHLRTRGFLPP